jgi:hypothetical protein
VVFVIFWKQYTIESNPNKHVEGVELENHNQIFEKRSKIKIMIPEKFLEVLKYEGVASIATQGENGPHLSSTWNSYLQVTENESLIYPAGGMQVTEKNIKKNNRVLMTVGSREVEGFHGHGTGFRIEGTATFLTEGSSYEQIKQKFPWARAAVDITIVSIVQTL